VEKGGRMVLGPLNKENRSGTRGITVERTFKNEGVLCCGGRSSSQARGVKYDRLGGRQPSRDYGKWTARALILLNQQAPPSRDTAVEARALRDEADPAGMTERRLEWARSPASSP